jgi:hypothetical protein
MNSNEESKEDDERAYQVKFGAAAEFAILPNEDPIEFEILRGELAEEHAPDGPLEEDLVLTIAKGIWRKRRYQNLLSAKALVAHYDPTHSAQHKDQQALETFYQAINGATVFEEIQQGLDQLPKHFADYLNFECPRCDFREPVEWAKAMQKVVREAFMPFLRLVAITIASTVFKDEVFARELEFEERIDKTIEQTLNRLEKVKAAKRQVSFREAQRFDRSHPGRLVRFVK